VKAALMQSGPARDRSTIYKYTPTQMERERKRQLAAV
jgi:hypothetical protein